MTKLKTVIAGLAAAGFILAVVAAKSVGTDAGVQEEFRGEMTQEPVLKLASAKKHHKTDGTFTNPWCTHDCSRGLWDFLKWRLANSNPWAAERERAIEAFKRREPQKPDFGSREDKIVWLGHTTVFIRLAGSTFLLDPIFGDLPVFSRRITPFPIRPEELPKIDFVLVSHGHYDHLDTKSVEFLEKRDKPVFITPLGYRDYFEPLGVDPARHKDGDWLDRLDAGNVSITFMPVQHWSKRSFTDTNRMLWSGFILDGGGKKLFLAGDTGYYLGFAEIGAVYGPFDAAILPAGAYEPRWFMKGMHMNPQEAVRATEELRAKILVPIHYETFVLSDEPPTQPGEILRELIRDRAATGHINPEIVMLPPGGDLVLN